MIRRLALLSLLAVTLAACGKKSPSPTADATPAPAATPPPLEATGPTDPIAVPTAQKGGQLVTWAGPYPKSLNAWLDYNAFSASVTGLMFEGLIEMDSVTEEPVGVLAESWEISPDKKTYTFKLHPGAKWSDGRPVTAEDVQFYYDVIMNPKNLTSLFRVDLSRFSRPEVIDERTVRITANEAHWKNFWAAGGFNAFPKHAWKDQDFNQINFAFPVVSGPYALGEVKTNRTIELRRRPDWWGYAKRYNVGKFNFDRLLFRAMEDRTKALEVLKKEEFDVYAIYTARIWAQDTNFPQVQKNWIVRQEVYNEDPKAFQGFALNLRRPLFQDVRARQALQHLLNRELMLEKIMFNEYYLLNSYFPDLYAGGVNPAVPVAKFDPARARALLEEAGWTVGPDGILTKDGQRFRIVILHHGEDLRHLNIYLEDLKKVGIDASIDVVSRATFSKRVDQHDFDLIWANWGGGRLNDPETMWSSKTADEIATQNLPGVKDPEIDRLIEQQKTELDGAKRKEILRQIDARLVATAPYVLMWQSGKARLLYWNKFGMPPTVLPKFSDERAIPVYWWFDPAKDAALREAQKTNTALPAQPAKVVFPR